MYLCADPRHHPLRPSLHLFWTEAIQRHKLVFARRAKRLTRELLERYSVIVGHCVQPESQPWLLSVGATFRTDTEFVISR